MNKYFVMHAMLGVFLLLPIVQAENRDGIKKVDRRLSVVSLEVVTDEMNAFLKKENLPTMTAPEVAAAILDSLVQISREGGHSPSVSDLNYDEWEKQLKKFVSELGSSGKLTLPIEVESERSNDYYFGRRDDTKLEIKGPMRVFLTLTVWQRPLPGQNELFSFEIILSKPAKINSK